MSPVTAKISEYRGIHLLDASCCQELEELNPEFVVSKSMESGIEER